MNDLLNQIQELYKQLQEKTRKEWQRDLPFDELLFNRWDRAHELGFGDGSSIYHNSYVYGDVKVGKNTWVGPFTLLDGSGGLEIGDYCCISVGVHIYSHNTVEWCLSGGKSKHHRNSVKIGDCCFIGPQSVIRDGVSIGAKSVIGAGSFVNSDIPPFSIAYGTPAKVKGEVRINEDKVELHHFNSKVGKVP